MEQLDLLERNLSDLIARYQKLQNDYQQLQEQNERQRQEMMRTHSEFVELQQRYNHLSEAHAISVAPEDKQRAYQQLTSLIQRVDRAIEVLKQ